MQLRLTLLCILLCFFAMISAEIAHGWQCPRPPTGVRTQQRQAVFLGTFQDLFGHRASYFWDQQTKTLIGPLDHRLDPRHKNAKGIRPAKPSKRWKPGVVGVVRYTALYYSYARKGRPSGWFRGFRIRAKRQPLHGLLKQIKDPFAAGLLLGTHAATKGWKSLYRAYKRKLRRKQLIPLMIGLLYTAREVTALGWIKEYRYRDVSGIYVYQFSVLKRRGLRGISRMKTKGVRFHWSDYLPMASRLWLSGKRSQLRQRLDRAFLRHGRPTPPTTKPFRAAPWGKCPPARWQQRGPFQSWYDFNALRVWQYFKRKAPAFSKAIKPLFQGVSASSKAYVVGKYKHRRHVYLMLRSSGIWSFLRTTKRKARAFKIGDVIRYIARGKKEKRLPFIPLIDAAHYALTARVGKNQIISMGSDKLNMFKALQSQARSGSTAYQAGLAFQVLFALTKAGMAGWKKKQFRQFLYNLPGNRYRRASRWLWSWESILRYALIFGLERDFSDEVIRGIPHMLKFIQRQTSQYPPRRRRGFRVLGSSGLPPKDVYRFVIKLAVQAALTHLAHKEPHKAHKLLKRVALRGASLMPKGVRWIPSRAKSNPSLMLRAARDLVRIAMKRGAPQQRRSSHGGALLLGLIRLYARPLRKRWLVLLHRAGYPKYRP